MAAFLSPGFSCCFFTNFVHFFEKVSSFSQSITVAASYWVTLMSLVSGSTNKADGFFSIFSKGPLRGADLFLSFK
jgi:hypothetical protein